MASPPGNELQQLLDQLPREQIDAIAITKLALDCFNSADGAGLFTGIERYGVLGARMQLCAVQANSLTSYWALLLRRMGWGVPPKSADQALVQCLSAPNGRDVLRVLAGETASIVTLARMAHDQDKQARRALRDAERAAAADAAAFPDQDWPQV